MYKYYTTLSWIVNYTYLIIILFNAIAISAISIFIRLGELDSSKTIGDKQKYSAYVFVKFTSELFVRLLLD